MMDLLFSTIVTIVLIAGWFYLERFLGKLFCFYSIKKPKVLKWITAIGIVALIVVAFINPLGTVTMVTGYFFAFCIIFDLIEVVCRRYLGNKKITRYIHWGGIPAFILTAAVMIYGVYVGNDVVVTPYEVVVNKELPKDVKMVYMSDLHIGITINEDNIEQYSKEIEAQNPDIVIIGGDLFDEYTAKEDVEAACKYIGEIESKYGTYYTWGNHEGKVNVVPGGLEANIEYMRAQILDNGMTIIQDEAVLIDDSFYLVGRMDEDAGEKPVEAKELMESLNHDKPIIVLEHKPIDVQHVADLGADLYLSGHTHGGQIFPLGFFESFIYDGVYGREEVDACTMIVSSGMGTWNTPIRVGSISEYLVINIIKE